MPDGHARHPRPPLSLPDGTAIRPATEANSSLPLSWDRNLAEPKLGRTSQSIRITTLHNIRIDGQ